jgi:hypothetical protein
MKYLDRRIRDGLLAGLFSAAMACGSDGAGNFGITEPVATGGSAGEADAAMGAGGSGGATGVSASGGTIPVATSTPLGGSALTGGVRGTGGAGAVPGLGSGSGGTQVIVVPKGGTPASGGLPSAGGSAVGGGQGTGGSTGLGGRQGTGGRAGSIGSGGKPGVGGSGSGGTSVGGSSVETGTGGRTGTGGQAGGAVDSGGGGSGGTSAPSGAPGNPDGTCAIPADAELEDVSSPATVIGTGTPSSCSGDAFIAAVAKGGIITFNCGPEPATIPLSKPAKVFNDKGPKIVIDGGGKITLDGQGMTRILYMNTCDEKQVWTSSHCDNQETPQLTVQNLTFINGNAKNESDGGGAIYASGGRFKVINSRFTNNVCADTGPDIGGGAIRAFQQYNGLPIYVVSSTFGGAAGLANVGSNGGALSSIGVSWTVLNSIISYNQAIGNGGNPSQSGTPGGGSGGGIYNDGNKMTLTVCGSRIEYNKVNAFGSAIFFVSNDHTGNIVIDSSTITNNVGGSWYPKYPQISMHDDTPIAVTNSTIK